MKVIIISNKDKSWTRIIYKFIAAVVIGYLVILAIGSYHKSEHKISHKNATYVNTKYCKNQQNVLKTMEDILKSYFDR